MDLTREEIKALKFAIFYLKDSRKRFAVGENLYTRFHAESQENQHIKYKEISKAIEILEGWLK